VPVRHIRAVIAGFALAVAVTGPASAVDRVDILTQRPGDVRASLYTTVTRQAGAAIDASAGGPVRMPYNLAVVGRVIEHLGVDGARAWVRAVAASHAIDVPAAATGPTICAKADAVVTGAGVSERAPSPVPAGLIRCGARRTGQARCG
jgi:hypothetical protein